ncbi:E3 ubiquitin-protein ligase RNFT1 isoform X2 [Latimeria chalumnae]|nr:PREDICTED: RING finger and transmembrane domain-containing protein 1 isoform X2 [Latimeria chalumnae]|eukprot:XP_005986872.1 PREDICTED: RING finger and transmembrane domain-containing protein 1 isoform X2 [Latimeria chalumnae]
MQTNSCQQHGQLGSATSPQSNLTSRMAVEGTGASQSGEVQIQLNTSQAEHGARQGARHSRPHVRLHSHAHTHSHSETDSSDDSPLDSGESSGSLSEMRYLFQWLQKSLPYILVLCAKLIIQHALGIAVGVGLLMTYVYANKAISNQVFLRERRSKLHCAWLLVFLTASSFVLYYTFYSQTLYCSLIFINPNVDSLEFWNVLWIVGITDFILKFLFMGFKCLILLVPSFLMAYKLRGQWYMIIEELCQYYRSLVPIPVWFRYLVGYTEFDNLLGWTFGILLALTYLILKLLTLFGQWRSLKKVLRIFCSQQHYGITASKRQCLEAGDICPICQAEFRDPILLVCQHVFCEECISLWFNREKTCPLCRTVITEQVNKWKDGATSPHLQIY